MKRELALDHAARRIDDKIYLAQMAVLREEGTKVDSGERQGDELRAPSMATRRAGSASVIRQFYLSRHLSASTL